MTRLLWYLFFLIPLTFLGDVMLKMHWPPWNEFAFYLGQTLLQTVLSVLFIVIGGFILAVGLVSLQKRKLRQFAEAALVLPSLVPVLFVVVSVLSWMGYFKYMIPPGITLVILVHTLLNVGLCAVLWTSILENKAGGMLVLGILEGASPLRLYVEVFRSQWHDVIAFSAGFFLLCFSSFSVPLILGGDTGATLEIYIYRLVAVNGDLGAALAIAVAQVFIVAVIFWWFGDMRALPSSLTRGSLLKEVAAPIAFWIGAPVLLLFCFGGLFFGLQEGVAEVLTNARLQSSLAQVFIPTVFQTFLAATWALLLYLGLALWMDDRFMRKVAFAFGALSTVILGLAFYLMPGSAVGKIPFALSYLFFPIAYKLVGAGTLNQIGSQVKVARLMGAGRWQVFRLVVLPQVLPTAFRIFGLVGFWSVGEYGITSVISGEQLNLALVTKSLLGGYHLEPAVALTWVILFLGMAFWLLGQWLAYVSDRKLTR